MEQIIIKRGNTLFPIASKKTATSIKSATQNVALLGDDTLNIVVVSPFKLDFLIGDTTFVYGNIYKLNRLPKVKKNGMYEFEYELEFEGAQYDMMRVTYDLTIDTTSNQLADVSGDSLTGNLRRFATVMVSNLNRVFKNMWELGECPDTAEDKTLTFSESENCLSVIQNLCKEFDTEFEVLYSVYSGKYTINFKKIGKTFPYKFEFGKNNGLYQLTRENVSTSNIVTRLKVYGSTENITAKYRAQRLCLPNRSKRDSYIEDAAAVRKYGIWEARKYFDDIKPSRTGKVEKVFSDSVLKFVDSTMFDLNEKDESGNTKYLLAETSAKVHFNTGNLAGYEFEVHSYDHATHTFTLKKQTDERGNVFPSESTPAFRFSEKDEYKLIDIALPQSYIDEAESELAKQGQTYYNQNSQPKVQYGLSVTDSFLASMLSNETNGNVIWVGDYIPVKDSDVDVDKSVRVKSFKRDLMKDYSYTLTISDMSITSSITNRVVSGLIEHDKAITINQLLDPARARANWRSSREVLNMVFDPDGDYYTDKIKPASIDTMALSVGAKAMQFGLQNTVFQPNYLGNANRIVYKGGVLTHYTIKEESAVSWILADGDVTLKNENAYYIYAKCSKKDNSGSIIFSQSQIKANEDVSYYHFFIGVLNSVDSELKARSLALTYGFTMINGRFIKTGRIESADGTTYFDLDNSEIGGKICFTKNGEKKTLEEIAAETLENKNYINNTLPGILDGFKNQIDGMFEMYFGNGIPTLSNEPAKDWNTNALKDNHLGDMYYDNDSGIGYRFSKDESTYKWIEVRDTGIASALEAASRAQDTADGKRRVFVATPTPPYDVGDLWVDGKELRRCVTAKTSGTYVATDWAIAVYYDNTKTTIDGGIVTSGTIQVAGDEKYILAGITGKGSSEDSIRFWAGTTFKNRSIAPFRVQQNGKVYMKDAVVEGEINSIIGNIGRWILSDGIIKSKASIDEKANVKIPAIQLDSINGKILIGENIVLDKLGLSLISNDYEKLRVSNCQIGEYSKYLVAQKHTGEELLFFDLNGGYIFASKTWLPEFVKPKEAKVHFGYFGAGTVLTINQINVFYTVPNPNVQGAKVGMRFHTAPSVICTLRSNGVPVAQTNTYYDGVKMSGESFSMQMKWAKTFIIDKSNEGDYELEIAVKPLDIYDYHFDYHLDAYDYHPDVYDSSRAYSIPNSTGRIAVDFDFTRGSYERTVIANDGLMSCWKDGVMMMTNAGFIVNFGSYHLKITKEGIKKSTDSGAHWNDV